ncbi:MAG: DUF2064 domain-containing protein [Gammaproteobacteria bacterium]
MPEAPTAAITLVLFCRRPGTGKRRLALEIGDAAALAISEGLLASALEDAASWPGPCVLSPADAGDEAWARALPVRVDGVVVQPAGNLGERLASVDRTLRSQGHSRLLYIGSDAPVLDSDYYALARDALARHDVVLGPALDGGVTCMGARSPWPDLPDLPWSSEQLHAALESACLRNGMSVHNLPPRYDVDIAADLDRLCRDLAADKRPARRALYRVLGSLGYCQA